MVSLPFCTFLSLSIYLSSALLRSTDRSIFIHLLLAIFIYTLSPNWLRFAFIYHIKCVQNESVREYLASKWEVRLTIYELSYGIWLRQSNCINTLHGAHHVRKHTHLVCVCIRPISIAFVCGHVGVCACVCFHILVMLWE